MYPDDPIPERSALSMRQQYYFQGLQQEADGDFPSAIQTFLIYSSWLSEKDRHIPLLWVSGLYAKLGDRWASLEYHSRYADGCSKAYRAEQYKIIGAEYEKIEAYPQALSAYRIYIEQYPDKVSVKKIESLEKLAS